MSYENKGRLIILALALAFAAYAIIGTITSGITIDHAAGFVGAGGALYAFYYTFNHDD